MKSGYEKALLTKCGLTLTELIRTSCPGSFTGNDRMSSLSVMLKMAVFAPMPRASVMTTISEKPGFLIKIRAPNRRSCNNVSIVLSRFRVQGSGFRVQGSGFRVFCFWFLVSGSCFRN